MKNPCWKCNERCVGCHAACERYNEWKAEQTASNAAIRATKAKATDYLGARGMLQFTNAAKWGV